MNLLESKSFSSADSAEIVCNSYATNIENQDVNKHMPSDTFLREISKALHKWVGSKVIKNF